MAIIACSECAHEVSDQAATCPHCGAPIASATKPRRRAKRSFLGIVIALALVCLIAATFWYFPSNQLSELLGQFKRKAEHPAPAEPVSAAIHPAAAERSLHESDDGSRPVYRITAEQLFQAYTANAVAMQSRIGNSRIRITGIIAEIDEDTSGHPVVRLLTSHDDSAEMMLKDDQRAAAAELVKGESVDIQCDKLQRDVTQRTIATPQGSGCALVSVDAGSAQAYLAVLLANEKGVAPVYIVGPMSKAACLSRGDSISAQLGEARRDAIVSKNCTATAQESIPSEGCRLSASMTALPDMPTAHLWRYDCAEHPAVPRKATDRVTAQKKSAHVSAVANVATDAVSAADAVGEPLSTAAESAFNEARQTTVAVPEKTPASASADAPNVAAATATATATATVPAPATAPAAAPAAALVPAAVSAPAPTAAQVPAANADAAAAPAIPADLVTVKAADPSAADRIVAYCSKATATASDQAVVAAGCRHEEVAAWTRFVLNNEFPTLDETARRKCSESPFPDSYVAKESCAKYVLNINR